MLNELLTWVLNTYLGKYLENFNPAQLSVALVSGEVELENVPIRKDALRSFGIPVEAISGSIGKIKLQIPVRQFRTSPWCIVIEGVYGVFGPKNLNEWDSEKEKQDEYKYKLSVLDAKEATWRLENDCKVESYYSLSYSSWLNYGATLATNILENLELKIKDIHLRYENTLLSSSPFSAGIRIQSISAQTCDISWVPGSKNNASNNVLYKLLEVNDLCLYWDQLHESNMCSNLTSKDLLINMNDVCKIENHKFILHPINATAKFKRERCKKAIRSKNRPRVSCAIVLPEVVVEINELQYNEFVRCLSDLQDIKQTRALKISRPTSDIKNNAKIWWKYAAKCHGFSFCSSKYKWRTAKDNIRYINTYKRFLINPSENLSKEDKQFKTEIEKVRSLNELLFLRDISCRNVSARGINVRSRNLNQGKGILYHWFPNWLGWCGSAVKNDEFYEKIEDDIFNAIKETIENDTFPNRDAIFANFTFSLISGKILLTNGKNSKDIALEMCFHNLLSFIDVKPKLSSFCMGISLGFVFLKDELTEWTEFPYIIKPQTHDKQKCLHDNLTELFTKINITDDKEPWFQLRYEKNPSEHKSDYKLTINAKSTDVFYNEITFKWLVSFFTTPVNDLKKHMDDILNRRYFNTRLKFLENWKSVVMGQKDYRKKWNFEVNISAPRIIFLENFKEKNTTVFVLDLGQFQLLKDERDTKSFALLKGNVADNESEDELFMTPCSTPPGSKISLSVSPTITSAVTSTNLETSSNLKIVINKDTGLENNLPDEIYDKYIINLTEMQVLVCKILECTLACSKTSSNFHLLDKFNITIQLERRTIKTSAPEYPAITLFGNLNKIVAHINEHNITESLRILNQISFDLNKDEIYSDVHPNDPCDKKFIHETQDTTEYTSTIIFQFVVDQIIIEVQSKEKSLAELQITGANAGVCKQAGKLSIDMSVHGFLLVDAIQPFGRDFDLLVASHRNIKLDCISGSLKHSGSSSSKFVNDIGQKYEHDDYLIKVEINIIEPSGDVKKVQRAKISFNNLDIIVNQETIVELLGVGKRLIDKYKLYNKCVTKKDDKLKSMGRKEGYALNSFITEINFDFHRLNILVLRGTKAKNGNIGRKIGTLTMIEAKIHAELGMDVCIAGALGGITVTDVAPECFNHQSILAIGMDPLTDLSKLYKNDELCSLTNEIYGMRDDILPNTNALSFKITQIKNTKILVKMRMASVWYTHCPKFIEEIYLCVREFKHRFKTFAQSLRNKATHMAKGFVHHLSSTNSKSTSNFGNISLDIVLSTPVLVLPRSHESTQLLIANLGQITVNNTPECFDHDHETPTRDTYLFDIRNVNFCSLDTVEEKDLRSKLLSKAYKMYSSNVSAILYDTALSFRCVYESKLQEGEKLQYKFHTLRIKGSVTEILNISLSRSQFEQLQDSLHYATHITLLEETIVETENDELLEEESVSKLPIPKNFTEVCIEFSVPILKLDLKNEDNISIIQITFEEFCFNFKNCAQQKETQVILRSVVMEDLKSQKGSKYRYIVDSSADIQNKLIKNLSSSCPNLSDLKNQQFPNKSLSIPASLNIKRVQSKSPSKSALIKGVENNQSIKMNNLVIYNSITTKYAEKQDKINSSLDFNSLNLIMSTEKWFMVFDFFGLIRNKAENSDMQEKHVLRSSQQFSMERLKVSVRSLTLILVKNESELSKANISCVHLRISKENTVESIDGRLGSISLFDLTPYGYLYKERFSTSGAEALRFTYKSEILHQENDSKSLRTLEKDAYLLIFMSSIKYVHTKRFIVEFHCFMKELLYLQSPVIQQLKRNEKRKLGRSPIKIGLELQAESPIILLPVSYNSNQLLVADLGKITLVNSFHYATELTSLTARPADLNVVDEIVDLMTIDLVGINFLTGELENDSQISSTIKKDFNVLRVGTFNIVRLGNKLFKEKCRLKLQVLRNIDTDVSHNIPDIKVEGTLSELHGFVNLQQYKLIRGFLNYNLGENIDDVYYNFQFNLKSSIEKLCSLTKVNEIKQSQSKWNTLSMNFLLENVVISLADPSEISNQTFACIKFIKSTLEIGSYSDDSMEIDLISTEILVVDARKDFPDSTPDNIFKYILERSLKSSVKSSVQAEIHTRKRDGTIKYTILLNNMRIMAILDFFEKLNNFLKECPCMSLEMSRNLSCRNMPNKLTHQEAVNSYEYTDNQLKYEFVLNITNSEIVFVENRDQFDTYAIILKSTTVLSYKPNNALVPISVDINHLEIFSCILGRELESSQSIIDPFSLSMELRGNCFQVQIQNKIFFRISYHDVMLFSRIMQSIPKQTKKHIVRNFNELRDYEKIEPLLAMGFKHSECCLAMEVNSFNINKAAIWLTQQKYKNSSFATEINSITLNASCISVCIIDDCFDSDVPLLEVSLSNLLITQKIPKKEENSKRFYEGETETSITCYYYNRQLSGWEPIVEPWQCIVLWKYSNSNASKTKYLLVEASSKQILKLNITSTLFELCGLVRKNWTEDYLKCSLFKADIKCLNTNTRKRLPFVPFALKNLTGESLIFNIFFAHAGGITRTEQQQDLMCNWISVQHNETVPFDFGPQSKLRQLDSHKLNIHQILVQIHSWTLIGPISIDKVGTYFRYASQDMHYQKKSRIVFEISLVGSAQKLIVVRSALNTVNKTSNTFLLRLKNEKESILMTIKPLEKITIPLQFIDSAIYLKPKFIVKTTTSDEEENGFSTRAIQWTSCLKTDCIQEIHSCLTPNKEPFNVLSEIKKDKYSVREVISMPGHTITIIPPLKLKNLLCCDMLFKIAGNTQSSLCASKEVEIYSVDVNESFCLSITLDNYKLSGCIKIPMGHIGLVEPKLKLVDVFNRELFLRISIQSFQGKGMEIFIGAPIWLINKTGLPIIFRQEGTSALASGQFDEHEFAREVSPLMFSFSDQEGSPSIEFRLGKRFGNDNKWCKSFGIHKETYSRELMAEQSGAHYVIGINVQKGTGLYNCTTFITLTPRFQLYNRCKHRLEFAQKCDIKEMKITSKDKVIVALPGCSFPFQWPNYEQEPLLCVRVSGNGSSHWSSGLPINEAKSVFINVRNELGEMIFLRLEVVLHGGAYILHFTDAYTLPPPIRIDNYSDVSIYFSQKGVVPHWRTNVKPQSSLAYVFDDPLGPHSLILEAPGGNFIDYALKKNIAAKSITYANFIYIAFKETFRCSFSNSDNKNIGIEGQQLVLGVRDKRVIITKKCAGDRSQLWLWNSNGQLEHEGSSPPTEFLKLSNLTPRLVLDLEKPPNPTDYTRLFVRPKNIQRAATQTWRFENGRLMCHANMCVQATNGVYGLQPGFDAVLGRINSNSIASNHIPIEQSIEIQKLRPGSGHLEVRSKMDGPIKCIEISDVNINCNNIILEQDPLWNHASVLNKELTGSTNTVIHELLIKLTLSKGLGISIVTRSPCEELAYISLEDLVFNLVLLPAMKSVDLKVKDMQIDNQLLDTVCPIVLHTCKSNVENTNKEALYFQTKLLKSLNKNAVIFECFILEVKPCTIILEEKFILKAALFLCYKEHWHLEEEEISTNIYQIREYPFSENAKRFYFEECLIGSTQVRLSVLTASKLDSELLEIKKYFGLTLIKFEDAVIEFDKFSDRTHFETLDVYLKALKAHYYTQLKWHAASILGSVDFLGNPLGFANDLSEGVSGLIFEGSVKSLLKNVTHGLSNSTAKLTETLSDSLGRVVLDEHDNETRQRILEVAHPTSGGHLTAGLKGFGFGILGGVTSIVRQTYVGAQCDGLPGFINGLGRGIVGTVTKPLIGVLDLASETASAVRETSRGSHHYLPSRKRLPRCVTGAPGGLLPLYSYRQSKGQQYLYIINRRNFGEKLIFYEPNLCCDKEAQLRLLVSTEYVRIFSRCDDDPAIMFECHLSEVLSCHPLTTNMTTLNKVLPNFYIEISTNVPKVTRPRVRCQNEDIAEQASRCINYAKAVFDERELSVASF